MHLVGFFTVRLPVYFVKILYSSVLLSSIKKAVFAALVTKLNLSPKFQTNSAVTWQHFLQEALNILGGARVERFICQQIK